ncbi:GntR family transcriptional regulator [Streptomyces alkaliterrae]|uniref:GntR family transcriptional regulator n=1 Tax=Streptomyces alkaliterrae TaxID=2213162 RepID=A0A5P0YMQ2_9ACTN|nr:GntR family transcriptional regulator [Streptomyces alkaliterrae]MBB1256356.1 GntR family transcriptional regulator [Streptomyces alkaliterrae]MBB1262241.1 GntR family transcriptional regulator [Streptomyces alkaliterrae]MQS01614.1 UTRA domain-containing protein [Streptomyces alkaliterrae]
MVESPRALAPYKRIAAEIRARIDSGELQPGDRIPSVREIIRSEGVSTATATRVAAVLRADGYAESVPGVGTVVVKPRKLTTGPDRLTIMRATGTGFREGERTEILGAERVAAAPRVADALGLEEGASVVQRRRIYYDGTGVVTLSTSWLAVELAEAAPELLEAAPLPKMTFGLIEERTGRRAVRRRDVVAVRPVPEDLAERLEMSAGTLTLTMANTYWDQHGNVTEYAEDFLGAGRELAAEYDLQ